MGRAERGSCGGRKGAAAFSTVELLVLIAILAVLAGMLLPALRGSRTRGQVAMCLSNLKQLQLGWATYSGDNADKLVRVGNMETLVTTPDDPESHPGGARSQWVLGTVDALPGATDPLMVRNGLLYSYVNQLNVYKCPADSKMVGGSSTVRSVSMNCWMNPIVSWNRTSGYTGAVALREFRKQTDITAPVPARCWVFMDENPAWINDGFFVADPNQRSAWVDVPASYHQGAGAVSFADGHAELKAWQGKTVKISPGAAAKDANSDDLLWLQERSTSSP